MFESKISFFGEYLDYFAHRCHLHLWLLKSSNDTHFHHPRELSLQMQLRSLKHGELVVSIHISEVEWLRETPGCFNLQWRIKHKQCRAAERKKKIKNPPPVNGKCEGCQGINWLQMKTSYPGCFWFTDALLPPAADTMHRKEEESRGSDNHRLHILEINRACTLYFSLSPKWASSKFCHEAGIKIIGV